MLQLPGITSYLQIMPHDRFLSIIIIAGEQLPIRYNSEKKAILVPSLRITSQNVVDEQPWSHQKNRIFSLPDKKWMRSRNKIIKLYASHFTSGPDGDKFAKQMATAIIPDRSEGIVKVSAYSKQYIACNNIILDCNHRPFLQHPRSREEIFKTENSTC